MANMKLNNRRIGLTAGLVYVFMTVCFSQGQYGWRGPERSGIYNESGLMKTWPSVGPTLLWEATGMGAGFSSAVVSDDAIYITGRKGEKDVLTSFSQEGKKNWEVIYGNSSGSNYPDSRCTPTYFKKYSGKIPQFDVSESPLVVDNKVIGTPGGNKTAMVAFNTDNGNVVWETPSINDGTNYVNPLLIETGGTKIIVTITEGHMIAVNPVNGKLLWNFDYEAQNSNPTGDRNHTNTPVYRDGCILAANGYEQVAVKLKVNPDGSEPSLVWKNTDLTPHVGGMVLLGNYIYSSTHDTNSKGKWICVDWLTGKTMWITNWYNKGSVISADGMLYIYEEKTGHVGLVKPDPGKLDVVSEFQITKGTGPYWAHPSIDRGRLFVRHGDYLAVYSLK
jgi:outer membrane protein assembly factor BamB